MAYLAIILDRFPTRILPTAVAGYKIFVPIFECSSIRTCEAARARRPPVRGGALVHGGCERYSVIGSLRAARGPGPPRLVRG
eukprot:COSAG02_NODE_1432_length_12646_cov_3.566988_18_plen_82_part_00